MLPFACVPPPCVLVGCLGWFCVCFCVLGVFCGLFCVGFGGVWVLFCCWFACGVLGLFVVLGVVRVRGFACVRCVGGSGLASAASLMHAVLGGRGCLSSSSFAVTGDYAKCVLLKYFSFTML